MLSSLFATRSGLVLAVVLFSGLSCYAQETGAMINKALDEQVKLRLDASLPSSLESISQQTGVRFDVNPRVWDTLPWGRQTTIKATVENQTLRQALEEIVRKLGLRLAVRDEAVEIVAHPALLRTCRRASLQELAAMDILTSLPTQEPASRVTIERLLEVVDLKLADNRKPLAIENRITLPALAKAQVALPRGVTLLEALDAMAAQTDAVWYPWGKSVVVLSRDDQARRELERPITLRSAGVDVAQVLADLAQKTPVEIDIQPGSLAWVATEHRGIRASFENAPLQQVLTGIAAATGLKWAVKGDKVVVSAPEGAAPNTDQIIGLIQLESGLFAPVWSRQVPDDIRQLIQTKTAREFAKMKRLMDEELGKPTTRP